MVRWTNKRKNEKKNPLVPPLPFIMWESTRVIKARTHNRSNNTQQKKRTDVNQSSQEQQLPTCQLKDIESVYACSRDEKKQVAGMCGGRKRSCRCLRVPLRGSRAAVSCTDAELLSDRFSTFPQTTRIGLYKSYSISRCTDSQPGRTWPKSRRRESGRTAILFFCSKRRRGMTACFSSLE